MDSKPKTFDEFQESIRAKKEAIKDSESINEYELMIRAGLTDDEIYFIAWCKCRNDRVDMEWEGFYRSDEDQKAFVQKMYEMHKEGIEKLKKDITNPEIIEAINAAERGEGIPWELPKPKDH